MLSTVNGSLLMKGSWRLQAMKVTLSRDEIKEIIKKFYGFEQDIQLEIMQEQSDKKNQPSIYYETRCNPDGTIAEITAHNEDGSLVFPRKNHKGMECKYQNTCKVCGKTFYTNTKPADCCSQDCIDKAKAANKKPQKKYKKKTESKSKSKSFIVKNPKNDYFAIGQEIEDFCNSSEDQKIMRSDTLTIQGLYYRYRVAAKMFGYDDKLTMTASKVNNGVVMTKKVKVK